MTESVEGHYGNEGIVERIVQALADAGFDTENLDPEFWLEPTSSTLGVGKEP